MLDSVCMATSSGFRAAKVVVERPRIHVAMGNDVAADGAVAYGPLSASKLHDVRELFTESHTRGCASDENTPTEAEYD